MGDGILQTYLVMLVWNVEVDQRMYGQVVAMHFGINGGLQLAYIQSAIRREAPRRRRSPLLGILRPLPVDQDVDLLLCVGELGQPSAHLCYKLLFGLFLVRVLLLLLLLLLAQELRPVPLLLLLGFALLPLEPLPDSDLFGFRALGSFALLVFVLYDHALLLFFLRIFRLPFFLGMFTKFSQLALFRKLLPPEMLNLLLHLCEPPFVAFRLGKEPDFFMAPA